MAYNTFASLENNDIESEKSYPTEDEYKDNLEKNVNINVRHENLPVGESSSKISKKKKKKRHNPLRASNECSSWSLYP